MEIKHGDQIWKPRKEWMTYEQVILKMGLDYISEATQTTEKTIGSHDMAVSPLTEAFKRCFHAIVNSSLPAHVPIIIEIW